MICNKCIKSDVCKLYDERYVGCISFVSKTKFENIKQEINEYLIREGFGIEYRNDILQIIDRHIGKEI